jgi:TonB family protein
MFEIPAYALGSRNGRRATELTSLLHGAAIAAVLLLSPVRAVWQKPADHEPPFIYVPSHSRLVKAKPLVPQREAGTAMPEAPLAQPHAQQGEATPGGFDISAGEIVSTRGFGGNGPVASGGFDGETGGGRGFLPGGTSISANVFGGPGDGGGGMPASGLQQELDEPAELLPGTSPEYTAEAKRRGVMGEVWLEVELRSSGEVHVLRVLSPRLGYGLEDAAVRAANQYRCKPARNRGRAVTILGKIKITFTLSA